MIGLSVIKAHFSTTVSGGNVELLCTLILPFYSRYNP